MESFSNDIRGILQELNQAERHADELISNFKKGFDEVVQKYVQSKSTPIKPSKKKAKGRIEKVDSQDDSFSSQNSSRSTSTATRTTAMNGNQSTEDEPPLMRPVRTGRAKPTCYKEPPLNSKMRRDGTMTVVNVKVERTSTDGITDKPKRTTTTNRKTNRTTTTTASSANTTAVVVAAAAAAATSDTVVDPEPTRPVRIKKEKVDEPKSTANKKVTTSSEATNSKKTTSDDLNDSLEIVPMETNPTIELLSDDENDTNKNDDNKMPPPSFVPPVKATKEKKATVEKVTRSTRSKQAKRPTKIKQEPVSESEDEAVSSAANEDNGATVSEEKVVRASRNATGKAKTTRPLNTSSESLYEDAVSQPLPTSSQKQQSSQQCDATFVTTVDETEKDQLSPRGTYIIPKNAAAVEASNTTFNVEQNGKSSRAINEKTVVLGKKTTAKSKVSGSSIMTEDDSDSDTGIRKYNGIKSKKDPKELFNPCASKPIKQRVEAFEKLQTPQKETRTRTRVMTAESDKSKVTHGSLLSKMGSSDSANKHMRTNSATRYVPITQKPLLTKSQSVEEFKKTAVEKKVKQDDKLKKAQQLREAQEKEKAEKQRKQLLEKEQRAREKAMQRAQEEMQRLQEQKRKEAEREQKRKEAMIAKLAKKAATDKKEQENYLRVLAEKKLMQEQLRMNKMKVEEMRKKNAYHFDMLESGDSTDDEGKTSSKRPQPPSWSTSQNRYAFVMAQSRVSTKITDKFFSVAPHEVNLREIFPSIDEKHLRRNSSAVWNSPPRYSTLPKY